MRSTGVLTHGYPTEVADAEFLQANSSVMTKYFGKSLEEVSEAGSDSQSESDGESGNLS